MTEPTTPAAPPRPVRVDIRRITLHGYSPGQRGRFTETLRARLAQHGVPDAAARQAAAAILDAVAAESERRHD